MDSQLTIIKNILSKFFRLVFLISFLIFQFVSSSAQQPGNVNGTKIWFISDKEGKWVDLSGNSLLVSPQLSGLKRNINFHNAIHFNGNKRLVAVNNFRFEQASFFGIFYPDLAKNQKGNNASFFYEVSYNDQPSFRLGSSYVSPGPFNYNPNFGSHGNSPAGDEMMASDYYYYGEPTNHSIWGEPHHTVINFPFNGYIPEFFVYSRVLSINEVIRVKTYLAIKYGITLDTSYVSSWNKTLWDWFEESAFNHRIVAIGKDKQSGLLQLKSNTTYEENNTAFDYNSDDIELSIVRQTKRMKVDWRKRRSLTVSLNKSDSNSIEDKKFLLWGDNDGNASQFDLTPIQGFEGLQLLNRKWKMLNRERIDLPTNIEVSGKLLEDFDVKENTMYFIVELSKDFDVINRIVPYTKADTIWKKKCFGRWKRVGVSKIVWSNWLWDLDKSGSDYFTFAKAGRLRFISPKEDIVIRASSFPFTQQVEIAGGLKPYSYQISRPVDVPVPILTDKTNFNFEISSSGSYVITVTDKTNQVIKRIMKVVGNSTK